MRLGRLIGIGIGIVILAMVFFVPFATLPGYVQHGETLFSAFSIAVVNLPNTQDTGTASQVAAALIVVISGLVIMLAGCVGIYPLGAGVLGVCGMGLLTAGPYLTGHLSSYSASNFDIGFYVIWALSIAALAMTFVGRDIPIMRRRAVEAAGATTK